MSLPNKVIHASRILDQHQPSSRRGPETSYGSHWYQRFLHCQSKTKSCRKVESFSTVWCTVRSVTELTIMEYFKKLQQHMKQTVVSWVCSYFISCHKSMTQAFWFCFTTVVRSLHQQSTKSKQPAAMPITCTVNISHIVDIGIVILTPRSGRCHTRDYLRKLSKMPFRQSHAITRQDWERY